MRRRSSTVAAFVLLGGLALASPATAHEGHGSCGEGAQVFIVPLAQSGQAGETASSSARAGTQNENVAAGHAIYCEPKP